MTPPSTPPSPPAVAPGTAVLVVDRSTRHAGAVGVVVACTGDDLVVRLDDDEREPAPISVRRTAVAPVAPSAPGTLPAFSSCFDGVSAVRGLVHVLGAAGIAHFDATHEGQATAREHDERERGEGFSLSISARLPLVRLSHAPDFETRSPAIVARAMDNAVGAA